MVDREPRRGRFRRKRAVALATLALAATDIVGPAPAASASPRSEFSVSSTALGEVHTGVVLAPNQEYEVRYLRGKGTVDYRNYPPVGPQGYSRRIDGDIWDGCKADDAYRYGAVIGGVGESSFLLGVGVRRKAPPGGGELTAKYNDLDVCKGDNMDEVDRRTGEPKPITYVVVTFP